MATSNTSSPVTSRVKDHNANEKSEEAEEQNAGNAWTDANEWHEDTLDDESAPKKKSKISELWGKLGLDLPTALMMMK